MKTGTHRRQEPSEDSTTRRELFQRWGYATAAALPLTLHSAWAAESSVVQTVTGPVAASKLGVTLAHEHIVTDLRAPADRGPGDYHRQDAVKVALPHLMALREAGCRTLVEITPIHIGRDVVALRELAEQSGLQIIAATGIYGAAGQKYIPDYAHAETAEQLAARYMAEAERGIDGSGVRPGIIKTGVNAETPLPEIERKLVRAAALAHKETGLPLASHTGPGKPALEELEILDSVGVAPGSFIWVHAQVEKDHDLHRRIARAGAWVEFDGVGPQTADWHVECVKTMKEAGLLNRTLISQDAGWYRPGEKDQSQFRGYTYLLKEFVPKLRAAGLGDSEIDQLLVKNPAQALAAAS